MSHLWWGLAGIGLACTSLPHLWEEPLAPEMHYSEDEFARLRQQMVRQQLEGRGLSDPAVLSAMARVPRQRFVPPQVRHLAYEDGPLPIGSEQTISQPYIVAVMSELAQLSPGDKVLEIGSGSGYQAAVLSEMGMQVYSLEILPVLSAQAKKNLLAAGVKNVKLRVGDGYRGWPEEAPFRAILVTAAPPRVPPLLLEQLAEGGKMVLPLGGWQQQLVVLEKQGAEIRRREIFPVRFVPMVGRVQEGE